MTSSEHRRRASVIFSLLTLMVLGWSSVSFCSPQSTDRYYVMLYGVADWAYVLLDNTGGANTSTPGNINYLFQNSATAFSLIRGNGVNEYEVDLTYFLGPGKHSLRIILWDFPKNSSVGIRDYSSLNIVFRKNEEILYEKHFQQQSTAPAGGIPKTVLDEIFFFDVAGCPEFILRAKSGLNDSSEQGGRIIVDGSDFQDNFNVHISMEKDDFEGREYDWYVLMHSNPPSRDDGEAWLSLNWDTIVNLAGGDSTTLGWIPGIHRFGRYPAIDLNDVGFAEIDYGDALAPPNPAVIRNGVFTFYFALLDPDTGSVCWDSAEVEVRLGDVATP